jgi:tetratricopeptide (TPR) repeat protein
MSRIGALRRIAPALLVVGLLGAPAALEGLPDQSRPAGASDFTTRSRRAEAAREAGRLDEAASWYRKALALRSTWKEGWWALGTILYEQDAYADAAPAFRRLVSLDPKNGTAHLMLALCEYQLDADASALAHIQTAKTLGVQTDGGLPHVLTYHEGMLFLRAGRYERALETLKPLVSASVEDENLDLALGMGVLLMRPTDAPSEGSPARAIVTRAGRAERRHLAKEFAAAKREYAALVRDAPAFPNVHYAYGRFLLATEDPARGIQEFLTELEAHPEHVRARVRLAVHETGDRERARARRHARGARKSDRGRGPACDRRTGVRAIRRGRTTRDSADDPRIENSDAEDRQEPLSAIAEALVTRLLFRISSLTKSCPELRASGVRKFSHARLDR